MNIGQVFDKLVFLEIYIRFSTKAETIICLQRVINIVQNKIVEKMKNIQIELGYYISFIKSFLYSTSLRVPQPVTAINFQVVPDSVTNAISCEDEHWRVDQRRAQMTNQNNEFGKH